MYPSILYTRVQQLLSVPLVTVSHTVSSSTRQHCLCSMKRAADHTYPIKPDLQEQAMAIVSAEP